MLTGYITVQEFKDSPYYCAFETCCNFSGDIDILISGYVDMATALVKNYVGYDLWSQQRNERFMGKDNHIYFAQYYPLQEVNSLFYRVKNRPSCTGDIPYIITDYDKGIIESDSTFHSDYRYELNYNAGYTEIPHDIKVACFLLIAQVSTQIDLGNIANPNVGQSGGKLDQLISYSVGNNTGVLSNLLLKSADEIKNLPITVYPILNRYRRGRLT